MDPGTEHAGRFDALLSYIRRQRGVDFASYKPASLGRRLRKRMQAANASTYAEYLDVLQATPEEFTPLLDTLFINVTRFFRDPDAWQTVADVAIPRIVQARAPDSPIRVWCAGVASGEESHTVAMLLAQAVGPAEFKERVKIYATDVDEQVLARARQSTYTPKEIENVPDDLRAAYFEPAADRFVVRADLRRSIVFGLHDLLEDAPISRLDLLICRNTLMYFNREAQSRVLSRFHFALRDDGFLFLGKAEMLLTRRNLFLPVDARSRVFRKALDVPLRDRFDVVARSNGEDGDDGPASQAQLRELAYEASPVPQVVLNTAGLVVLANEMARKQLGITRHDLGRPFRGLDISFKPVELRGPIQEVLSQRVARHLAPTKRVDGDGTRFVETRIDPILNDGALPAGVSLSFVDVTEVQELRAQVERARGELGTAYEELQSTIEELETTNEELQSTVEELETTNEELHSTNEELETMNEELQSSNEEIRAVNAELRQRGDALTLLNAYMRSILNSMQQGVAVLNDNLDVHLWNARARDLWGMTEREVEGKPFLSLDIGLPVGVLKEVLQRALGGDSQFEALVVRAHNRRGKELECRVTAEPLLGPAGRTAGVILLMEEWRGEASTVNAE